MATGNRGAASQVKYRFPESQAARVRKHWELDSDITFLNHGSFGACPKPVLEAQSDFRARLEREPVRFFLRECDKLIDEAYGALGQFIGANPDGLVFVSNATAGVNTVLRSLVFDSGDELLITSQGYNACNNAMHFVAEKSGAKVVVAEIPFPIQSADEAVQAILEKVTAKTRLVLVDHVTSPTALVLPVERIVGELKNRGIDTLIDGAHAPGMLPLDLNKLGAAYYTGNCHKWMCTPKGAAFLHVRQDKQALVRPLSISHGANSPRKDRSRFRLEFDWTGTVDPTPWLSIPAAITFLSSLFPGGMAEVAQHNRLMVLAARQTLSETFSTALPAPESMIGSLAAVVLPDAHGPAPEPPLYLDPLQETLFTRHHIEVPIIAFPRWPKRLVRVSAQIYNDPDDYQRLGRAIGEELQR
jgi:isopenicillin-N epimerase